MGFQESDTTPAYVTSKVNTWMTDWLSISHPNMRLYGLIVRYTDSEGKLHQELINENVKLEALYKICRSNVMDIFYLLTKIYIGQVKYTDFIHFVSVISNRLNKIKETQQTVKSENERFQRLNKLEMEIRKITANARKTLLITQ